MSGVVVGSVWRDKDRREAGERAIVVTRLDTRYAYGRSEREPHTRTRVLRQRLTRAFTLIGQINMAHPEHWPAYFAEDVPQGDNQTPGGTDG